MADHQYPAAGRGVGAERARWSTTARAEALRLETAAGVEVAEFRQLGGEHRSLYFGGRLADGREIFVKAAAGDETAAALAAEANGLRWLCEVGAVSVPGIVFAGGGLLAIEWLPLGAADESAADDLGRALARLHVAGSPRFGAPWPGYIASLPLPNDQADSWPSWYAQCRLLPYCRLARDTGSFQPADVSLVEAVASQIDDLAGPDEPPSRIHGDLWSGNVRWSGGRGWLIDPAAHGGHRETDLAMLQLFGAPYCDRILAAYREVAPLADGWRARIPLHQLHPLLVHVCLFGGSYRESALSAARAALSA